jgi:murein DD-endopeptidase MepM/ murein hydrolase activator NlpD
MRPESLDRPSLGNAAGQPRSTGAAGNAATGGTAGQPGRVEIVRLAQEFEAMLLTQMLREMRKSMVDERDDESGFGSSTLTDVGDAEFARSMSAQGGIGLADALLRAFESQLAPASSAPSAPGGAGAPVLGLAAREVALPNATIADAPDLSSGVPLARVSGTAPISSQFGWRRDPLTGAQRFHDGIDIAMAYGRDVKAAADGRVVFSGVQNGYGNTVVIDHGNGRQTRYAHLSDQTVQPGDVVREGQTIGKSGNSGRSTGPHLHFEMTVQGRPVDPRGA